MPITFGSVGDIISISFLIKDLIKSLDDIRGSSAEYHAVIRELRSLDHAVHEVEELFRTCTTSSQLYTLVQTIEQCAVECRTCLLALYEQIARYRQTLQDGGSGNFIRDAASKVRWQMSEKEKLAKCRTEIAAQCLSLNILLGTVGVRSTQSSTVDILDRLSQADSAHSSASASHLCLLAEIQGQVKEINALVKAGSSERRELASAFVYIRTFGAGVLSFVQKLLTLNFLTYNAVVSLQNRIPAQLDRCWAQKPVILEDALGRVTPFHLEFIDSWEAFQSVLEVRFRQLPGHRMVEHGEYALRSTTLNRDIEPWVAFDRSFIPGQCIKMSMVFYAASDIRVCPTCGLVAAKAIEKLELRMS